MAEATTTSESWLPPLRSYSGPLAESLIVGGWSRDRGNGQIVHAQIDGQLAAMVRQVIDRIAHHDVPRVLRDGFARNEQPPGRHQVIVVGLLQRGTGGPYAVLHRLQQLRVGAEIRLERSGR